MSETHRIKNVSSSGRLRVPGYGYVDFGAIIEVTREVAAGLVAGGNFAPADTGKTTRKEKEE